MSAIPPLSGEKPTSRERAATAARDLKETLVKQQEPPGRIKSLQEGLDHSWDAYFRQTFAVLCSAPNMQWRAL